MGCPCGELYLEKGPGNGIHTSKHHCLKRLIMFTILESFRKQDPSCWMPSKDRFTEMHWNRQKASLWQEEVGNTQTGRDAQTKTVEPILFWPVGMCLRQLFTLVPGFLFSWVYRVKDEVLQGSRGQVCCTNIRRLYPEVAIKSSSWRKRGGG